VAHEKTLSTMLSEAACQGLPGQRFNDSHAHIEHAKSHAINHYSRCQNGAGKHAH